MRNPVDSRQLKLLICIWLIISNFVAFFSFSHGILGLALSSRKNLCINPEVMQQQNGKIIDGQCQVRLFHSWTLYIISDDVGHSSYLSAR